MLVANKGKHFMKKIAALGLSSILALPLVSATLVFAEDAPSTTKTTTTTTTTQTDKATAEELAARNARVEKRKTDMKLKLTTAQKTRIQARCKASQGLISSVKGRLNGIETSRSEVYKNILDRLADLSAKLKNKGADTTALDADIANLKTQITTFNTDLAAYKVAVADLVALDCGTDPDGFKASLEAARTALAAVNKDGLAIKAYLNDTIKPLLKTIREQLEPAKTPATGGQ